MTSIRSDAFRNTRNLTILLQGNTIISVAPDAFPVGVTTGGTCEDFDGWTGTCEADSKEEDLKEGEEVGGETPFKH